MGSKQTLNVLRREAPLSIRASFAREAVIELEKVLGGVLFFEKPAIERATELCHELWAGYINHKAREPVSSHVAEWELFRALVRTRAIKQIEKKLLTTVYALEMVSRRGVQWKQEPQLVEDAKEFMRELTEAFNAKCVAIRERRGQQNQMLAAHERLGPFERL